MQSIINHDNNNDKPTKKSHFLKKRGLALVQRLLQVRKARVNLLPQLREKIMGKLTDGPPQKVPGTLKRITIRLMHAAFS